MKQNYSSVKKIAPIVVLTLLCSLATPPLGFATDKGPQTPTGILESATSAESSIASGPRQKITMDLKGVDILDVLKILSKQTGLNIVAGREVQGNVTLFLQEIDAWNALRKILETANLAYVREEGIVRVISEKEYEQLFGKPFYDYRKAQTFNLKFAKASEIGELLNEIKSSIGRVIIDDRTNTVIVYDIPDTLTEISSLITDMDLPTQRKVFALRYSIAEDLEAKLKSTLNPVTGSLEIDKRSNKIYVSDIPERVRQAESIIQEFDIQPAQVLIEAKVVEITLNDQTRYGVDWNLFFRIHGRPYRINSNNNVPTSPTSGPLANATLTNFIKGQNTGITGDNFNYTISALEGIGKTNVLSSPRLTVLNNQEAKLAVATREPFISQTVIQGDTTATTADNVQFVDVGVTLTVKPTITEDNHVIIKIKPAVSSSGTPLELQGVSSGSNTTFVRTRVPVVTTQEVETTVIVRSGSTIIMGGLIQDRLEKSAKKVPVIGDIPIIGVPFRSKSEDFKKTELVVFLTPYILKPNQNADTGRYLNEQGELLDFDKTIDVKYTDSYKRSNDPTKRISRPYWQKEAPQIAQEKLEALEQQSKNARIEKKAASINVAESQSKEPPSLKNFENKKIVVIEPEEPASRPMEFPSIIGRQPVTPRFKRIPQEEKTTVAVAEANPPADAATENKTISASPSQETPPISTLIPENQSALITQEVSGSNRPSAASSPSSWQQYYQALRKDVLDTLRNHSTLKELHGDLRIEFTATNSGQIRDINVLDTKDVRGSGQKTLITEALKQRSAYTPLPQELGKSKKVQLTVHL